MLLAQDSDDIEYFETVKDDERVRFYSPSAASEVSKIFMKFNPGKTSSVHICSMGYFVIDIRASGKVPTMLAARKNT